MSAETPHRNSSVFSTEEFHRAKRAPLSVTARPEPFSLRSSLSARGAWLKEWIVPPNVLAEPPAAFAELTAYAHRGAWTSSTSGPLRRLAGLWLFVVVLPATFLLRMAEWLLQRPSRALFATVVWQLVIRSDGPGPWLSAHLFRPILSGLGWIFLS